MGRLAGKIVLVTGGASGIGAAIIGRMAGEGAIVVPADVAGAEADRGNGSPAALHMDVSDPASVDAGVAKIVERYGRLDCLVNAAGIGKDIPFLETPLDVFDKIMAVNLRGTFIAGQAAARVMRATGGGAIVNIASVSGMAGICGRSAYGASKGGVVLLSQVMAIDLAAYGIRVNVLAPGPVETPLVARMHTARARERWIEQIPMRRYARPDEMAGVAVFLCSDDASYVTGHVLAADGGFLAAGLTA